MTTHADYQPSAIVVARQRHSGVTHLLVRLGTILSRSLAALAEQRVPSAGSPMRSCGEDLSARLQRPRDPQPITTYPAEQTMIARTAGYTPRVPATTRPS